MSALERVDLGHDRAHPLDVALVLGAEDGPEDRGNHIVEPIIQAASAGPRAGPARARARRPWWPVAAQHAGHLLDAVVAVSDAAVTRVRPPRTFLTTRRCCRRRAAIGARCVTQSTWRPSRGLGRGVSATTDGHASADAGVHLVEHQGGYTVGAGQDRRERQHGARQLAARDDLGQRPDLLARVRAQIGARPRSKPRVDSRQQFAPAADLERRPLHPQAARARAPPETPSLLAPRRARRSDSAVRGGGQLARPARSARAPARPPPRRGASSRSRSRAASARKASIAASVSPYLRLSRARASSRSSIASSRPGSALAPSRRRRIAPRASSSWMPCRSRSRRPAARTPDRGGSGPGRRGPRAASRSAADCGASSRSATHSATPALNRSACCRRRRSRPQRVLLALPELGRRRARET